jgi:hypothetical protein
MAHLVLRRDNASGTWTLDADSVLGGATPGREGAGFAYGFDVDPAIRGAALADLMTDAVPLAYRIVTGWRQERDGHRMVGRLNRDATSALYELHDLVYERGRRDVGALAPVYDARDWVRLSADLATRVRAAHTEADIERIVAVERRAANGRALIRGDLGEAVRECGKRQDHEVRKRIRALIDKVQ